MKRGTVWRVIALIGLLSGLPPGWCRADTHHILWEVKGRHNTVYLLGSVHMLRPGDASIPPEALRAYAASKTLVMELDLNAVGSEDSIGAGAAMAMLPEGQTLSSALGSELYAKLKARAETVGLDLELVDRFEPWFAALMLEQFELSKAGFDAASGVDMQFAQRAQSDGKAIIGLETMDEQLAIFAQLSANQQRDYMRSTLDENDANLTETNQVVRAWQEGDTAKLEQLLREDSRDSPELYRKLTIDRNHKWLPRITQMLNDDDNYLIIVGALHLIGHDGVIDLLQRGGYSPVQH
jgi:uncharacterized protein YbaP (TraB family)